MQKAQALRRQNKEEEAWKILLTEPEAPGTTKPDGWWEERRANAYAALRLGKPKMAYELVREPGPLSINAAKDAAFLAGWLACATSTSPSRRLAHFQTLGGLADGPLSRARAGYWLGRTWEVLGDKAKAREQLSRRRRLLRHLPRPAWPPQARSRRQPAEHRPAGGAHGGGNRPLQRLRCGAAIVVARKAGLDRALRARLPAASARPPQERGRGGHASAPRRGARRHANVGAHRQGRRRARHEPRLLRLPDAGTAALHAAAQAARARRHPGDRAGRRASSTP